MTASVRRPKGGGAAGSAPSKSGTAGKVFFGRSRTAINDDADDVWFSDPPYFVVRPRPFYQRQLMQSVHLPCVAHGDPTPTIVWRRVSVGMGIPAGIPMGCDSVGIFTCFA